MIKAREAASVIFADDLLAAYVRRLFGRRLPENAVIFSRVDALHHAEEQERQRQRRARSEVSISTDTPMRSQR